MAMEAITEIAIPYIRVSSNVSSTSSLIAHAVNRTLCLSEACDREDNSALMEYKQTPGHNVHDLYDLLSLLNTHQELARDIYLLGLLVFNPSLVLKPPAEGGQLIALQRPRRKLKYYATATAWLGHEEEKFSKSAGPKQTPTQPE